MRGDERALSRTSYQRLHHQVRKKLCPYTELPLPSTSSWSSGLVVQAVVLQTLTDAKAALRAQIVDYLRERSIVVRLRCTREQLVSYHSTRARESPGLCAMSNSICLRAACYIWKQSSCSGKPSEPAAQRPAHRQRAAQACLVCLLLTPVLSVLVIVIDGPAQEPLLHALAACMNLEERSLQKNSAKLTHTGSAASPRALRSVQVRNQKSLLPTQRAPRAWGYGLLWARGGTRVPWPLSRKCSRATLTTFSAPSTSHRGGWGAGALTEGRKGVRWQLSCFCCQNWARGVQMPVRCALFTAAAGSSARAGVRRAAP